jgi:hypothetical protein
MNGPKKVGTLDPAKPIAKNPWTGIVTSYVDRRL